MAYTSPTISASSQTFANLQSRGALGYVQALVTAQTPSAAQLADSISLSEQKTIELALARFTNIVDNYIAGAPVTVASVDTELATLCFAMKCVVTAIDEIGALVDANTGTLTTKTTPLGVWPVRTFP